MISIIISVEPFQVTQMQICLVHHGSKRGILHTQFAGNAEISVTSQCLFHSSSIQLYCVSLIRPNHVFQHLFVLLQQPTAALIARMQRNTSLLFVRCTTLLMMSMCACSGPCVFSDQPHRTISRTLCRILWAFSKFQPCAPPTRSGK